MEKNEKHRISFFTRIKWAIFNLENYDIFAVENTKRAVGYLAKLILLFSLITSIGVTYKFANMDMLEINKTLQTVSSESIQYINTLPKPQLYAIFYIVSAGYLYIVYSITTAIDVLLLSLLGYITSRISKIILRYLPIINISVYSLTLSIILNTVYILVNSFTGFEIKYFQIMYNSIAYVYLITAILMIKNEMIKQEIELAKLAEEQQKIKEELERQQDEEREKQEQKKKEKDNKKENDENDKETDAPEGSSAITPLK